MKNAKLPTMRPPDTMLPTQLAYRGLTGELVPPMLSEVLGYDDDQMTVADSESSRSLRPPSRSLLHQLAPHFGIGVPQWQKVAAHEVRDCAVDPAGSHFATAVGEAIQIRSMTTGDVFAELRLPNDPAKACRLLFSPDTVHLAAAYLDGRIGIWSLENPSLPKLIELSSPSKRDALSIAYSADGQFLAVGFRDGYYVVYDLKDNEVIYTDRTPFWDPITALAFTPNNDHLAVAKLGQPVQWYAVKEHTVTPLNRSLFRQGQDVGALTLSASGSMLAAGFDKGRVKIRHLISREAEQNFLGHTQWVTSLAFSSDERLLATASEDGTVRVWDVVSGGCLARFTGHHGPVESVHFLFDDQSLMSSSCKGSEVLCWAFEDYRLSAATDLSEGPH